MPTHVPYGLRGFPSRFGRPWDAVTCPDEVDGDIWIWSTSRDLNLSSTKLPRPWSPWETSPSRKNPHGRTGNHTRDLMISSQKLWLLDHRLVNEKENWSILTDKEIYTTVNKPTITETIRLQRLRWFGHVQGMKENRISKRVLYMILESTRPRGRPRNRWQEKVFDREEWKKVLRTARNRCTLNMLME
jgi:hypothetical protein